MFIFNTTFVVNSEKFSTWEKWLNDSYKPLIKNVLPACEVAVYEVMAIEEKATERTISVQWKVATPNDLATINHQSPIVLNQMSSEFGPDALYFSSILKSL